MTVADLNLALVMPEILLAVGAMALLMLGVFERGGGARGISGLAALLLLADAILVMIGPSEGAAFNGAFVVDGFGNFMKVLTLVGAAVVLVISQDYLTHEKMDRFEYPVLILLATLGMCMMISASDLIALYMGLELQSLALYVIAAFKRNSQRSTEAGLKYFVLGALSSGMLLYGASMIYGFTGTVSFEGIAAATAEGASTGVIIGLVFIAAGLAFKVSAVPFHMWTPDVYEGAPTPVTAFFAMAPKVAAMALFVRVMIDAFGSMEGQWQQIIIFISIASMILGGVAAIGQTNIKRLMAYSSIGHMGYALVGLAAGTQDGIQAVLIYMAIYMVMSAGVFVVILSMRRAEGMVEGISDLAGLSRNHPGMAFALAVLMFSLAGIPPLAGFPAKFYVFLAAVDQELYMLAVVGLLASVISAFYYIRIVKIMYFDEPAEPFAASPQGAMGGVLVLSTAITALYVFFPAPLIAWAESAAATLF
ncbi:MAG: NADH-quinone oxidoreductase subunit NuoN [Alphaproteobacteria bacterium]